MRKIYIIGAMACLFAACKPSVRITIPPTPGTADFTNYLAIGNSLTAGYADGSLTSSGQLNSYPERLFEQFQLVTTTKGTFVQPLVTGNNGYPHPKLVLALTHSSCTGDTSLGPVNFPGPLDSLGSFHYTSTVNNGQINNIGVPGIRAVDYPVAGYAVIANAGGAPYALRFYNNPNTASPLDELGFSVHNLHPTFFTMWLGANDVLGYATGGGQGDGGGAALPIPGTVNLYNTGDISPYGYFDTCYDQALNVAISTGARGALINIPDITTVPFFTTVPVAGLILTRQGQADSLQAEYSLLKVVFQVGANNFMIQDHAGKTRQSVPGELILLTVPSDSITCAGWGSIKPIPKQYVLTIDEIQNIKMATSSFNAFIQSEATTHKLAYIDMNTFMGQIASGYTYNGVKYTAQYVSGGAFSLDGIHLTPRGYALVANQILQGINNYYKATIPMLDVNKYHGIDFP